MLEKKQLESLAEAPAAICSVEELLEAVDWGAHGFEIVQPHYPDWKFAAAEIVTTGTIIQAMIVEAGQTLGSVEFHDNLSRYLLKLY